MGLDVQNIVDTLGLTAVGNVLGTWLVLLLQWEGWRLVVFFALLF